MSGNKFGIFILSFIFIIILLFPLVNEQFKLIEDIPNSENRRLARKPKFNISRLNSFPVKYEKYYNDNFSVRSLMLKYFNRINIEYFKKSPLPEKVIIGKSDWLFMGETYIDAYTGKNSLTQLELDSFKLELEYRKKYLIEKGCKFYFAIAPSKATIYHEYLPASIYKHAKLSWGESLINHLNLYTSFKPIDVFDVLKEYKKNNQLYFMTDTHWNELGAFYVASEIIKQIQKDFPEISQLNLNEYNVLKTDKTNGNISSLLGDVKKFEDYAYRITPKDGGKSLHVAKQGYPCVDNFPYCSDYESNKEIKNSKAPKILIITDSFGQLTFPYLAEKFGRSVMIFDGWQYKLNEEIFNKEKPDVMLLITLEGNLRNMLRFQSRLNENKNF